MEEKIYSEEGVDWEKMLKVLMAMNPQELEIKKKEILKTYHNTYVFSKHLCENLLVKNREHVPLVISRPSIVGASWKYPFPGWISSLNAAGLFFVTAGTGIIQHAYAAKNYISTSIPVDFCTDQILMATAFQAKKDNYLVI